jgi:hypothetical protein
MHDRSATKNSGRVIRDASLAASTARVPDPSRLVVRVVEDWESAAAIVSDLDDLSANALEPSPSSEAWMLIPALHYLREAAAIKVVLMYAPDVTSSGQPDVLCAVFPLQLRARYRGLPIKALSLWNHMYSLSTAPLLRADCAAACLRTLVDWTARNWPGSTLLEFPELGTNTAFFRLLSDVLRIDDREYLVTDMRTRAAFRPGIDAERYLGSIGTAHHRHELRRQEKRLSELGKLEFDELDVDALHTTWVDEFVALELAGWKGKEGTAFGCNPSHRAYLDAIVAAANERGRLMMLALRLNGKAVAMKLNLVDVPGSYAFKIAFDEAYAKYSPGTLLELENIRRLHVRPEIRWMDSLASPEHQLMNKVWHDRLTVVTLLVAPRQLRAEVVVNMLPLLRLIRRWLRRGR